MGARVIFLAWIVLAPFPSVAGSTADPFSVYEAEEASVSPDDPFIKTEEQRVMLRDIRAHLDAYLDLKGREREAAQRALVLLDGGSRPGEDCAELK